MPESVTDPAANGFIWRGWRRRLTDLPYVVIDLETTGLDPSRDRVIELAVCAAEGLEFSTMIDPGSGVTIEGPHGISAEALTVAPGFEAIAWRLRKLISGRILVAHNAPFDIAFLHAEFARLRRPLPPTPFICTVGLAQALALGHESRSLAYACHRHGVSLLDAHTAAGDALAAAELFRRYTSHADGVGLDLRGLAATDPSPAGAESWAYPPPGPPRRGEFVSSLAALPRATTAVRSRNGAARAMPLRP